MIEKILPYVSEMYPFPIPASFFVSFFFFFDSRVSVGRVLTLDLENDADVRPSITIRHVDGSVTNYGSSKRDSVLGVEPGRLPSHPLNFLAPFARPLPAWFTQRPRKSIFSR